MKNIAIDLGNTFAKIGWFDGNSLERTLYKINFEDIEKHIVEDLPQKAIISSTSHDTTALAAFLQEHHCEVLQLNASMPVPIIKNYDTPQTLGADRVATAVAASWLYPNTNCLIIDIGTCITYDWLSDAGVFEGGIISLGLKMRLQAMHSFTKRLPLLDRSDVKETTLLIGKNTKDAMLSGAINGLQAEINGIIERYQLEKGESCVLLCGGDAPFFESRLKFQTFVVPNLVLTGLNRILTYNVQS